MKDGLIVIAFVVAVMAGVSYVLVNYNLPVLGGLALILSGLVLSILFTMRKLLP